MAEQGEVLKGDRDIHEEPFLVLAVGLVAASDHEASVPASIDVFDPWLPHNDIAVTIANA